MSEIIRGIYKKNTAASQSTIHDSIAFHSIAPFQTSLPYKILKKKKKIGNKYDLLACRSIPGIHHRIHG